VGQRKHVLDGDPDAPREGAVLGVSSLLKNVTAGLQQKIFNSISKTAADDCIATNCPVSH